jgi:chorismate dehydratase
MTSRSKIAMVSYLNSKPFEFGLKSLYSYDFEIITATPAKCASLFKEGSVDIALIPVGALTDLDSYEIISDYCIGCDGEVRTVCIFSNTELAKCKKLLLDDHSRTSYLLSQVLTTQYLNVHLPISSLNVENYIHEDQNAVLMIGDKVFEYEKNFAFKYDLGVLWKEWTGLPFAFAVWISKTDLDPDVIAKLNSALNYGIQNLDKIIEKESSENLDLYYYFKNNIQYQLDTAKKTALKTFLEKAAIVIKSNSLASDHSS